MKKSIYAKAWVTAKSLKAPFHRFFAFWITLSVLGFGVPSVGISLDRPKSPHTLNKERVEQKQAENRTREEEKKRARKAAVHAAAMVRHKNVDKAQKKAAGKENNSSLPPIGSGANSSAASAVKKELRKASELIKVSTQLQKGARERETAHPSEVKLPPLH